MGAHAGLYWYGLKTLCAREDGSRERVWFQRSAGNNTVLEPDGS
jgi:hypothetical protein